MWKTNRKLTIELYKSVRYFTKRTRVYVVRFHSIGILRFGFVPLILKIIGTLHLNTNGWNVCVRTRGRERGRTVRDCARPDTRTTEIIIKRH